MLNRDYKHLVGKQVGSDISQSVINDLILFGSIGWILAICLLNKFF